jgi:hypothetical protein
MRIYEKPAQKKDFGSIRPRRIGIKNEAPILPEKGGRPKGFFEIASIIKQI